MGKGGEGNIVKHGPFTNKGYIAPLPIRVIWILYQLSHIVYDDLIKI